MSDAFFNTSKTIANDFLQSVVFIDDRAFLTEEEANEHEFSAIDITRAFANSQKVCAVYRPENKADISNLALLAKKADVSILDWRIEIDDDEVEDGSGEEDVEEIDPRGTHTLKIIREILADPLTGFGSLKLILIYTGETDLPGIATEIHQSLLDQNLQNLNINHCTISTENIRIVVLAKQNGEGQFQYNPDLQGQIVPYDQLPEFIVSEFTKMTSGLLSDFVLKSLSTIRANTFRLIKLYKKELDPSFLAHWVLLPNPHDSQEQLIEMFAHSVQALLNYNDTANRASVRSIIEWIDSKKFTKKIKIDGKDIHIDNHFLKNWIRESFVSACQKYWIQKGHSKEGHTPDRKFKSKENELYKEVSSYFNTGDSKTDSEFSMLTHHKSNLKQPSLVPKLTLGTLIKQLPKTGNTYRNGEIPKYYLCIQAKCDSVRIKGLRKFLFLPLEKVEASSPFQLVVEDDNSIIRLRVKKEPFQLRTIKFEPKPNQDSILGYKRHTNYFFRSNHDERFKWLADLKDAHAQRELNLFASQVSRVGLDESEWLRIWSKRG